MALIVRSDGTVISDRHDHHRGKPQAPRTAGESAEGRVSAGPTRADMADHLNPFMAAPAETDES